jgi:DNA modification methylase
MNKIYYGDCRQSLKGLLSSSVQTVVTSPPYFGLRDYGNDEQIGLEDTVNDYIDNLAHVFHLVKDVLNDDGTLWLNIADSYASFKDGKAVPDSHRRGNGTAVSKGLAKNRMAKTFTGTDIKNKDLIGIPWMLALRLRADGWYLRQSIIWEKPNPRPESVTDRCTNSHEYIFLFSKSERYKFNHDDIKEFTVDGLSRRNRRSVWTVPTKPYSGAHFATFPEELITPCVLAGSDVGDIVLDPFLGSGTTAATALKLGRKYIGMELNSDYEPLIQQRLNEAAMSGAQNELF